MSFQWSPMVSMDFYHFFLVCFCLRPPETPSFGRCWSMAYRWGVSIRLVFGSLSFVSGHTFQSRVFKGINSSSTKKRWSLWGCHQLLPATFDSLDRSIASYWCIWLPKASDKPFNQLASASCLQTNPSLVLKSCTWKMQFQFVSCVYAISSIRFKTCATFATIYSGAFDLNRAVRMIIWSFVLGRNSFLVH